MDLKLQGESSRILESVSDLTNEPPERIVSRLLLDKYRIAKENKFSLLLDLSPNKKAQLTFCADKLQVSLCKALLLSLGEMYVNLINE
jgi:hypothetical protein